MIVVGSLYGYDLNATMIQPTTQDAPYGHEPAVWDIWIDLSSVFLQIPLVICEVPKLALITYW